LPTEDERSGELSHVLCGDVDGSGEAPDIATLLDTQAIEVEVAELKGLFAGREPLRVGLPSFAVILGLSLEDLDCARERNPRNLEWIGIRPVGAVYNNAEPGSRLESAGVPSEPGRMYQHCSMLRGECIWQKAGIWCPVDQHGEGEQALAGKELL
jgi:hypothetical protein